MLGFAGAGSSAVVTRALAQSRSLSAVDQEHLLAANDHRGYGEQPQRRIPDVASKLDDEFRYRHSPVSNRDRDEHKVRH